MSRGVIAPTREHRARALPMQIAFHVTPPQCVCCFDLLGFVQAPGAAHKARTISVRMPFLACLLLEYVKGMVCP